MRKFSTVASKPSALTALRDPQAGTPRPPQRTVQYVCGALWSRVAQRTQDGVFGASLPWFDFATTPSLRSFTRFMSTAMEPSRVTPNSWPRRAM